MNRIGLIGTLVEPFAYRPELSTGHSKIKWYTESNQRLNLFQQDYVWYRESCEKRSYFYLWYFFINSLSFSWVSVSRFLNQSRSATKSTESEFSESSESKFSDDFTLEVCILFGMHEGNLNFGFVSESPHCDFIFLLMVIDLMITRWRSKRRKILCSIRSQALLSICYMGTKSSLLFGLLNKHV